MSRMVQFAVFEKKAPELSQIIEAMSEISGLEVTATDTRDPIRNLYDIRADLAFACSPRTRVSVSVRRPGAFEALRQIERQQLQQYIPQRPKSPKHPTRRITEIPDGRTVHIEPLRGQEPTLWYVAALALEKLGGELIFPISEDIRLKCGQRITETALKRRRFKSVLLSIPAAMVGIPLAVAILSLFFVFLLALRIWYGGSMRRGRA